MSDVSPIWTGRSDGDGQEHARWHSVVRELTQEAAPGVALIGFPSDEGVRRNLGRTGASEGPTALRQSLGPLAAHDLPALYDAGDVPQQGTDLERSQVLLGERIGSVVAAGHFPLVLGGGHEVAFGSYLGIAARRDTTRSLGVINIDAHFDLRSSPQATSGTGFLQMLRAEHAAGRRLAYTVLGIAPTSNTVALFETAASWGVTHRTDFECGASEREATRAHIAEFVDSVDDVYLTLDLDALPASVAPGVSAPASLGVPLEVVHDIVTRVAASGKLVLFDVAELNPSLDRDNATARVAARLIDQVVRSMPSRI